MPLCRLSRLPRSSRFSRSSLLFCFLASCALICTASFAQAPNYSASPVTTEAQALHIANRLGYGPKPGDLQRIMQMGIPAYIQSQLQAEKIPLPADLTQRLAQLETQSESTGETLGKFLEGRAQAKDEDADKSAFRLQTAHMLEQTAQARLVRAIDSPRQLEEVMVEFWFNHFNVYAAKGLDRALVSSYERDAIRPNVFGNFRTLLGAVAKHPAMLFYLDNWLSTKADFAPHRRFFGFRNAQAGADNLANNAANNNPKTKAHGLNENYARELMELHTLGVNGGYTQQDVTELARMLTGWTFDPRRAGKRNDLFVFDPARHDNGSKLWLGRNVSGQGQREGEMALDVLALHPATANYISTKLVQFFVQDQPPPALVQTLAKQFLASGGEIRPVLQTLFSSPEFMAASGSKFKTPYQFVISAARAANMPVVNIRPLLGTLAQLGMPLYGSPTPDGYKNTESAWLNSDALSRRIQFATAFASGRLPVNVAPPEKPLNKKQLEKSAAVVESGPVKFPPLEADALLSALGPGISSGTRELLGQQPAALRGALILGSPDFMRH